MGISQQIHARLRASHGAGFVFVGGKFLSKGRHLHGQLVDTVNGV